MTFIWIAWALAIIASFAVFESYALKHNKLSLSRLVYDANKAWPMTGVLFGMVCGGAAVHFFWTWNPACQ